MKRSKRSEKSNIALSVIAVFLVLLLAALILLPRLAPASSSVAEGSAPAEESGEEPEEVSFVVEEADSFGWYTANGKRYYLDENGFALTGLHLIGGKYFYFDAAGVMADAVGVDVSVYNEAIDWKAVRSQGISFAIIRVGGRGWTSGSIYGDLRAREYLRGAREAGLQIGVYFFSTAVNAEEAVREADDVLHTLEGHTLALPIFIDVEYSGEYPEGRADKLSAPERAAVVSAFCKRVESAGYRAGVYSGQYFYRHSIDFAPLTHYTVWLASYTADRLPPAFEWPYDILQFTDRGNVKGILCGVDMDVLFQRR